MRFAIISRALSATISLVACLGLSSGLAAQRASGPTLNEILQRLEANLNRYDTRLPSVFCDEHVVSQVEPATRGENSVTDSVFRLKRTANPDHTTTLVESREIKRVDGKPATSQDMDGPTLLRGAFEGGLAVVSLNQTACMNYDLQRINRKKPDDLYMIRFANVLTPQNTADCLLQEKSSGRVSIDPASMQITHLEITTPKHEIIPGNWSRGAVVGKRVLTVDYAPVALGNETFWMPTVIAQSAVSGDRTYHRVAWSFRATYRNYHKLEVTSRIVPTGGVPGP